MTQPEIDQQLIEFVKSFTKKHGFSPTLIECAQHLGVTKTPVRVRVVRLAKDGRLKWRGGSSRTLRTTGR